MSGKNPAYQQAKENRTVVLPQILWQVGLAVLFLVSCGLGYQKVVPMAAGWRMYILPLAILIFTAILQWSFSKRQMLEWIPAAGSVIALLIMGPVSVFYGLLGAWNQVIDLWNQTYDDSRVLVYSEQITEADIRIGSIWLMLILAALAWKLIRVGKTGWLTGISLIVLMALVLLGCFDIRWGVLLMLCGGSMWMWQIGGRIGLRQSLWLTGLTLVLFVVGSMLPQKPLSRFVELRENVKQEIYILRYGEDTLPHGDLYQAHTMLDGEENTLVVHTEYKKNLYLEGYVGAEYADGIWQPLPISRYGGERYGMFNWLEEQGFQPMTEYYDYYVTGAMLDADNRIEIENVGADRRLVYVPYAAEMPDGRQIRTNEDEGYYSKGLFGSRRYQYTEYSGMLPTELLQAEDWVGSPVTNEEVAYTQAEAVYRDFVYANYLDIQPQMQNFMNRTFWQDAELDNTGVFAATDRIRTVLAQSIAYVEEPEAVPTDVDPIQWGLLDAQEGNAAMFASIAVQAYRAYGIPARYAEGYLVQEGQIDGETVTLTNKNSHAWVEIYMDGMGWMPVEVTPGFYHDMYELSQMVDMPQNMQKTAALEKDEDHALDMSQDPENPVVEEDGSNTSSLGKILGILAVILGILICGLMITLELRRWWIRYREQKDWDASDEEGKAHLLNQQIQTLFQILEIPVDLGWNVAVAQETLRQRIPTIREGECQRVNGLLEQVLYGEIPLKPYEQRTILAFIDKLTQAGRYQNWKIRLQLRYRIIKRK